MKHILFLILICSVIGCDFPTLNSTEDKINKSENADSINENKYSIIISASCSYTGELVSNRVYGFPSDNEAQNVLRKIMNYTGLPVNFKLIAADVDNACAVIQKKNSGDMLRYIMYNQQFMIGAKDLTKTHWSEVSILAHEIGHHLAGHTLLQGGSRPDLELEADRFSGYILYKMGASLDEAQIAVKTFASINPSSTHPAKYSRLVAITNGWLAAKEQEDTKQPESDNQQTMDLTEKAKRTIEMVSSSIRNKIISALNHYYQINNSFRCNELVDLYLPIVENFYNKSNQPVSDIINECISYHNRWPYQQVSIDNSTFSITQLDNGDYFVTYDMFYRIKKNIQDKWKDFYLTINVRFTPDLKIKSMYEYKNPKL